MVREGGGRDHVRGIDDVDDGLHDGGDDGWKGGGSDGAGTFRRSMGSEGGATARTCLLSSLPSPLLRPLAVASFPASWCWLQGRGGKMFGFHLEVQERLATQCTRKKPSLLWRRRQKAC